MNKAHPRDWENPGRVRVQWKKDGRLVNPAIKTSECLSTRLYSSLSGPHIGHTGCIAAITSKYVLVALSIQRARRLQRALASKTSDMRRPNPNILSIPFSQNETCYTDFGADVSRLTEKQLLEMISIQIQMLKPDNVPKPPYDTDPQPQVAETPAPATPVKGKQPAKGGSKATSVSNTTISPPESKRRPKVPSPPQPWPPLTNRVSPYSPALPSGVLIETVKAGMSAQEATPGIGGGGGKGKRKVVRVRG